MEFSSPPDELLAGLRFTISQLHSSSAFFSVSAPWFGSSSPTLGSALLFLGFRSPQLQDAAPQRLVFTTSRLQGSALRLLCSTFPQLQSSAQQQRSPPPLLPVEARFGNSAAPGFFGVAVAPGVAAAPGYSDVAAAPGILAGVGGSAAFFSGLCVRVGGGALTLCVQGGSSLTLGRGC